MVLAFEHNIKTQQKNWFKENFQWINENPSLYEGRSLIKFLQSDSQWKSLNFKNSSLIRHFLSEKCLNI